MSDTTTPILGLVQPAVGGSADTWGDKSNSNETIIDGFAGWTETWVNNLLARVAALEARGQGAAYQEPVGTVKWWPSDADWPSGYVIADGTWYPISEFPLLFEVLSNRWGGDGVNNFAVPDLRGQVLVGMDMGTGRLQGQYGPDRWYGYGGSATVTLAGSQVPPHTHGGGTDGQGWHYHNVPSQGNVNAQAGPYPVPAGGYNWYGYTTDEQGFHYHNVWTDTQGGGGAHTNCQPGVLGYWIIKALLF